MALLCREVKPGSQQSALAAQEEKGEREASRLAARKEKMRAPAEPAALHWLTPNLPPRSSFGPARYQRASDPCDRGQSI